MSLVDNFKNFQGGLYDGKVRLIDVILKENFQSATNNIKLDVSRLSNERHLINIPTENESVTGVFINE